MAGQGLRGIENTAEVALDDFNTVVFATGDDVGMSNGRDPGCIEVPRIIISHRALDAQGGLSTILIRMRPVLQTSNHSKPPIPLFHR
jgi:hypothetical protein